MSKLRRGLWPLFLGSCLAWSGSLWAAGLSGTWVLDPSRSDPVDALLKAQGVGLMQRTLAARASITQTVVQQDDTVTVTVSAVGNTKTNTLVADGVVRVESTEKGTAQVRSTWEGDALVTVVVPGDGSGTLTARRWVSSDGATLTQRLLFVAKDGRRIEVDRVFKRR